MKYQVQVLSIMTIFTLKKQQIMDFVWIILHSIVLVSQCLIDIEFKFTIFDKYGLRYIKYT